MAAPRKSAKRSTTKKRPAAKRQTKKAPPAKKKSKRKGQARKGLKAARRGLSRVMKAGGKTWRTLKATTTQVVEGVKDTLAG